MSEQSGSTPSEGETQPYRADATVDVPAAHRTWPPGRAAAARTARTWRLGWRFWAKLAGAYAVALAVVYLLPMDRGVSGAPPVQLLLAAAVTTAAVFTPVLWWVVRRDLQLPARIAVYAVIFNVLVLLVKFAFAPYGLYEANRLRAFESYSPIDDSTGAVLAASCVFFLYASVMLAVYLLARRHLPASMRQPRKAFWRRFGVVTGVMAVAASLLAGSAILVVVLLAADAGLTYVDFVFSSSASFAVAVQLAVATVLANRVFAGAADRSRIIGDASLMVAVFWVCLAFLALYHALWVIYILLLTSVWPLKTVVPK